MKSLITLTALALAGAACAPVDESMDLAATDAAARCFHADEVDNFRITDEQQIYIHTRRSGAFRLDASVANCADRATTAIEVEPYVGASHRLCPGEQARVRLVTSSNIPRSCIVRIEGPITDSSVSGFPG
jgi:hypothetical protein